MAFLIYRPFIEPVIDDLEAEDVPEERGCLLLGQFDDRADAKRLIKDTEESVDLILVEVELDEHKVPVSFGDAEAVRVTQPEKADASLRAVKNVNPAVA